MAQQREQLVREMDVLKRSKSKNLLKKGFKKLKGKIQVRISRVSCISGAYELPKAARSVQLRRTAFAFTRI